MVGYFVKESADSNYTVTKFISCRVGAATVPNSWSGAHGFELKGAGRGASGFSNGELGVARREAYFAEAVAGFRVSPLGSLA